jgi:uncharacterized protein DUF6525
MSANVRGGNYRTTKENAMKAFDKLPPEARSALANAVEDWVPQPFLTKLWRGYEVRSGIWSTLSASRMP